MNKKLLALFVILVSFGLSSTSEERRFEVRKMFNLDLPTHPVTVYTFVDRNSDGVPVHCYIVEPFGVALTPTISCVR